MTSPSRAIMRCSCAGGRTTTSTTSGRSTAPTSTGTASTRTASRTATSCRSASTSSPTSPARGTTMAVQDERAHEVDQNGGGPPAKAITIGALVKALEQEFPDISISKVRYLEDQKLLT